MLPYYIVFMFLTSCCCLEVFKTSRKLRSFIFVIAFLILVLFSGLRYFPQQQDYSSYQATFNDVCKYGLNIQTYFERGYVCFMFIVSKFTESSSIWFIILAMTGVGLNFIGFKRYSTNYIFLSIICYFSHTFIMREMGAVRAGVAAGICLLSISFVERKKVLPFICSVFAACLFHLSAAVFFLFYPIYRSSISKKTMFLILCVCILVGMAFPFGNLLANYVIKGELKQLSGYAADISGSLGVFSNLTTVKQLVFVLIGLGFYDSLCEKIRHYKAIFLGSLISVCWLMIWNDFPIVAGRFAMYFSVTEVLLLPSFLYILNRQSRVIGVILIIVFAFTQLYLNGETFLTPESGYYPYNFRFSV